MKRFSILLLLLLALVPARAANHYVKTTGTSSGPASDWNTAWGWSTIPWANVSPGDTLYLAGGDYGFLQTGKAGTSGNVIRILRATSETCSNVAGWSAGYDSPIVANGGVWFNHDYVTISGVRKGGILIHNSNGGIGWSGGKPGGVNIGAWGSGRTGCTIAYANIWATGDLAAGTGATGINAQQAQYCTVDHCYVTNCVNGVMATYIRHCVFSHNEFAGITPAGLNHANVMFVSASTDCTFRDNFIHHAQSGTLGIAWENVAGDDNNYLYGNVFWNNYGGNGGIQSDSNVPAPYLGRFYIYNNTFVNSPAIYFKVTNAGGIARNNLFYNTWGDNYWNMDHDYNFANSASASMVSGEGHSIADGSDPFVDLAGGDFRLKASIGATYPRNKGLAIASVSDPASSFQLDPDGNIRGADGAWDIGAYEYSGASTNPVILVMPSSLSTTFGLGTTNNLMLQVQNAGVGTLAGTASIIGASGAFTIISGQTYSLTAGQSQQVTIRCVPATTNDGAVIRFTDGGGKDVPVTNRAQLPLGLSFAATAGIITAPFSASGGYVSQAVQTGVTDGGQASYAFAITNAGNYMVSALVNAPSTAANSFYVNIDSMPTDPAMIWDVPVAAGFVNRTVSWRGSGTDTSNEFIPKVFSLSSGMHQLIIIGREANAQLGQITIAPYSARPEIPLPPEGPRIVSVQ